MMRFITLIFLVSIQYSTCSSVKNYDYDALSKISSDPDPDWPRNVTELISSKGYPVKDYTVQTKDGYLLSVQRILSGKVKFNGRMRQKPVVFLQHGLLSSSADWVMNFPNQSLGFILADAGYDVWLGNIRGNTYSKRHVHLNPKSKEFWQFSFDEMAKYDLPAMIDLALNISGQQQLFYVGHSQGTTTMFALLSENPEYNKKVKLFIALAPVATVGHITSAIRYLAPFTSDLNFLFEYLGANQFLPNNAIMKYFSERVCESKLKFICEQLIFLLCGTDFSQLNETRLGVYVAHTPAGASTQSVIHYAQMVNSKNFQKYDFGISGNLKHYNQTTPPEYQLEKITAPVALMWSKNDKLADTTDIELLHKRLHSVIESYLVKFDQFSHLDFVWGIDAKKYVYDNILSLIKAFSATSYIRA